MLVVSGAVGAGHLPLLPDGLLSGGGLVLLQLPENLPMDHQHLQTGPILLLQGDTLQNINFELPAAGHMITTIISLDMKPPVVSL